MKRIAVFLFVLNLATIGFGAVYWLDTQDRIAVLEEQVDAHYREALTTNLSFWHVQPEALTPKYYASVKPIHTVAVVRTRSAT